MISIIVHLLQALVLAFAIFSYGIVAFVIFMHVDTEIDETGLPLKIFLWLLSPLIILDIMSEKLFGKGLIP